MSKNGEIVQRPKGTKDYFGLEQEKRTKLMNAVSATMRSFAVKEIETPIFEHADLFVRAAGETSDIVSKEMYSFEDKKGRSLVLRPEGTASVARAIVENQLYRGVPLKLFYHGPMFRYENPQSNRQRQFTQVGLEIIGTDSVFADLETVLIGANILRSLSIDFELSINSLGDAASKESYWRELREYFSRHIDKLNPASRIRLEKNPFRILDDKTEQGKDFVATAPTIDRHYSPAASARFAAIEQSLFNTGIRFKVDKKLVRGLDYYTDFTFEFISTQSALGSQRTLIGGGRYNNLLAELGGMDLPAVGLALGVERITNEMELDDSLLSAPDIYVLNIVSEDQKVSAVFDVILELRASGLVVEWNYDRIKLTRAFVLADRTKAPIKLIIGDEELKTKMAIVKTTDGQIKIPFAKLSAFLNENYLAKRGKSEEDY